MGRGWKENRTVPSTSIWSSDWLKKAKAEAIAKRDADPTYQYEQGMLKNYQDESAAAGVARQRQQDFDPYAAANRATEAQFQTISRDLREDTMDLRGSQVGSGRLRTGFGYGDEDLLYRGAYESFGRSTAERSMQAAGLEQRNIGQMQISRELAPSIAAGGLDYEMAKKDYESQKKGGFWGGVGGIVGGVAGFIGSGGNPMGAAAGSEAGGNIFRGLFS